MQKKRKALVKARKVRAANIDARKKAEAKQRADHLQGLRDRAKALDKEYDQAFNAVQKYANRKNFTDEEAKLWNRLHTLGNRLRGTYQTLRNAE
jgi:DNA-binding ferritin-like protein (Dps family)